MSKSTVKSDKENRKNPFEFNVLNFYLQARNAFGGATYYAAPPNFIKIKKGADAIPD